MTLFLQQLFVGLATGSVYALVAYGYGLIFVTSRIVNFAQGQLFMVGAVVGVTLLGAGVPYGAMVPLTVAAAATLGVVLERSVMIPLRYARSPYTWIVATLAAAAVIDSVVALTFGKEPRRFPAVAEGSFRVGDLVVGYHSLVVLAVAVGVMVLLEAFLARSFTGKAIRATADNPTPARLSGIPVGRLVTLSFGISGAIAGLGGVLVGPITFVAVPAGLLLGLKGFIAAVIGGLGSFRGALVGGLALGLAETVIRQQLPAGVSGAILFGLLLATLLLRPGGLFGREPA